MLRCGLLVSFFTVIWAGDYEQAAIVPAIIAQEPVYYKPQPYAFGYAIKDAWGNGQHRHEVGDEYNTKRGSYGFTDANGIYRRVDYIADGLGFRAVIKTNEPGTTSHEPAHARYHSHAVQHVQHVPVELPLYVDATQHLIAAHGHHHQHPYGHGHYGYH